MNKPNKKVLISDFKITPKDILRHMAKLSGDELDKQLFKRLNHMKEKTKKPQPKKIEKIYCAQCNDLLIKNYPYSPFNIPVQTIRILCLKCNFKKNTTIA